MTELSELSNRIADYDRKENERIKQLSPFGRELQEAINKSTHVFLSKATGGISPASLLIAYWDWIFHLLTSPGKQIQLVDKAFRKYLRLLRYFGQSYLTMGNLGPVIQPLIQDKRFKSPEWQWWPFNFMYQSFLHTQQWWYNATTYVPGLSKAHENVVEFSARQLLDMFSPSNFLFTNPEVLRKTWEQGGQNLLRGAEIYRDDMFKLLFDGKHLPNTGFNVGKNIACTEGKVVYRNHLIELIQYAPVTEKVHAVPLLIVPAWIMKYYILDLSPNNSFIRYLTQQGFTVFCISWRNPDSDDRDLDMEAYRELGICAALTYIKKALNVKEVHGIGYCLGGTLLSLAAAYLAREGGNSFKTLSLLAAQVDFTEAGELTLFIDESQVTFLEDSMWQQGYLDTLQMAGAFQLLRSNDLIWSRMVEQYLKGEKPTFNDLMAWNADTTRMPYKMHSEYLRKLFLNNEFAAGKFLIDGRPVVVADIRAPMFCVGTEKDHVAPWESVYKIHLLADTDVTFVLTSGGHNAGIVSEPGHPRRHYRISTQKEGCNYVAPKEWLKQTAVHEGSWWPAFSGWLKDQAQAEDIEAPTLPQTGENSEPLEDAPGTYVFQQ